MELLITHMDARRLRSLLASPVGRHSPLTARLLRQKLERARVVAAATVPPTVATMNSKITCWDPTTATEHELAVVYPWASSPELGLYSILSRVGIDLLGTTPGRHVVIDGTPWRVLDIAFQPEAEHAFHL